MLGAVAIFAIALGVNASIGMTNGSRDVALSDLVNASEANAECVSKDGLNNGRCNDFTKRCVLNPFPEDQNCDFYSN